MGLRDVYWSALATRTLRDHRRERASYCGVQWMKVTEQVLTTCGSSSPTRFYSLAETRSSFPSEDVTNWLRQFSGKGLEAQSNVAQIDVVTHEAKLLDQVRGLSMAEIGKFCCGGVEKGWKGLRRHEREELRHHRQNGSSGDSSGLAGVVEDDALPLKRTGANALPV